MINGHELYLIVACCFYLFKVTLRIASFLMTLNDFLFHKFSQACPACHMFPSYIKINLTRLYRQVMMSATQWLTCILNYCAHGVLFSICLWGKTGFQLEEAIE